MTDEEIQVEHEILIKKTLHVEQADHTSPTLTVL